MSPTEKAPCHRILAVVALLAAAAPARPQAGRAGERSAARSAQTKPAAKPARSAPVTGARAAARPQKEPAPPPPIDLSVLVLRRLGPAVMGGRVVDLAVREDRPQTFYVATASGGLWRTVNDGTTFEPLFQHEDVVSIGAVALAPSNPDIVWVGTGEANNRNSTSWGHGVYKSTDGGKTWQHMGLSTSRHIARIAIHPRDPNIVFVAACGSLWGPGGERGLFRTKDGGKTWEKVLGGDERTGAGEVRIDPKEPRFVYAALYERQRDRFDGNHPAKRWGKGSGLYRSEDGGDTWVRCTEGLPTVQMGRIAIDVYRKDPRIVWALIETEWIGKAPEGAQVEAPPGYMGIQGEDGDGGARLTEVVDKSPAAKAGLKAGDLVVEFGGEATADYDEMIRVLEKKKAGEKVPLKVLRAGKVLNLTITLGERPAPGGRRRARFADRIGGQVANVQGRQGPQGFQTGGVFRSEDHGRTWKRVNSLNPRPYYFSQIRVDPTDENNVYVCGIAFHVSRNRGKTFSVAAREVHVDHHALWVDPRDGRRLLLGCDGGVNVSRDRGKTWEVYENFDIGQAYHAVADTRRPYWIYAGFQDNGSWGFPSETRRREGILNLDCFKIGSGDGFVCRVDHDDPNIVFYESQGGNIGWLNVITGRRGRVRKPRDSYNWNTPFLLSHFNQRVIYFAGTKVYRSPDRGRTVETISPKITRSGKDAKTPLGPPSAKPSATALAESARKPGILWVGTDDGGLWVTKDGGRNWTPRHDALAKAAGLADCYWVSYVWASRFADGRAYVALDGHRQNDFRAFAFVTEDFGETWKPLAGGLPEASVHCIVEDTKNEDLLYLGTETGLWISLDRGRSWRRLPKPFPTVAVRDVDIQEQAEDLVLATHGRSVWTLDVGPLRALTKSEREKPAVLLPVADVLRLRRRGMARQGHRFFAAKNPEPAARIYYHLCAALNEKPRLRIVDFDGKEVFARDVPNEPGLHRVDWRLTRSMRRGPRSGRRGRRVPAGIYTAELSFADVVLRRSFRVEDDEGPMDVSWPRPAMVGEGPPAAEAGGEDREGWIEDAGDFERAREVIR